MIKTFVACTSEVDDVQIAIEQIKSCLKPENGFLKNTIGIAACHYEFVLSGIFKEICEALPFDIVGTISTGQSVGSECASLLFTLMVLTSDDVEFDMVLTSSLQSEAGKVIETAYKAAARPERPAMIFSFAPFMPANSGDEYVNTLSGISGGVPVFGTLAVDDTLDFSNCFMLVNGEHYNDRMSMLLFYGKVHPEFFIANISESKMLEKSAVITGSAGHVLMEVNERPVIEYFEDLGLVEASETQYAMTSLPFLLDYNDGTPKVSKIFIMLTQEKYALCGGAMPVGSTLNIAKTDKEDVLLTTGNAVNLALKSIEGKSGFLIYSCISRSMAFGSEQFREIEFIKEKLGAGLPFMMALSGGEICPTMVSGKEAINRFHNNAFVLCLF